MLREDVVQGRLAGWVRVSHHNSQMDSQREVIESFVQRIDNKISVWYLDPDRPRWKASLSAVLARMVRDAQEHKFDWIVLDKQQRLGTYDHTEFFYYIYLFKKSGVRVWSVAEGELTTDEIGSSFRSLAGSHSEKEEQRNKAGNVARGMLLNANKGYYNGAIVPLGYDRVCISPEGNERFRLIDEGRERNPDHVPRSKKPGEQKFLHAYTVVYPNGHAESLTQLPGKGKQDRYVLRRSTRGDRVRDAHQVFVLYDAGLNCLEIARKMNREGVDRGLRTTWTYRSVRQMLENPVYGGVVEWLKRSNPKYMGITKDGRYVQADYNASDPTANARENRPGDRVRAEPNEDLRLVGQDLIDRVAARLARESGRTVRPRSDSIWMRPFLRCGHCGGPMYGSAAEGSGQLSYFRCGTYVKGKERGHAPTCVNNRVYVSTVLDRLDRFLEAFGAKVDLDLGRSDPRLASMLLPVGEEGASLSALLREMRDFALERLPEDRHDLLGVEGGLDLIETYRDLHDRDHAGVRREVAAIVDEIRQATKALRRVEEDSEAERILLEDLRELEARKVAAEADAVPVHQKVVEVIARLEAAKEAIRSVARFAASRRTREAAVALEGVLAKVEVFSKPSGDKKGTRGERFADRLVFHPIEGAPIEFKADPPKAAISTEAEERARELLRGGTNLSRICKVLAEEGFKPPRSAGWQRSSLVRLLKRDLAAMPPEARDGRKSPHRRGRGGSGAG